jgi:excisionase family DNA binding protein
MANDEVLTTTQAARLLGVSVRTAQLLIEGGTLRSWKTPGGHRRVYLAEVLEFIARAEPAPAFSSARVVLLAPAASVADCGARLAALEGCTVDAHSDVHAAAFALGARQPAAVVVDLRGERDGAGAQRHAFVRHLIANPALAATRIVTLGGTWSGVADGTADDAVRGTAEGGGAVAHSQTLADVYAADAGAYTDAELHAKAHAKTHAKAHATAHANAHANAHAGADAPADTAAAQTAGARGKRDATHIAAGGAAPHTADGSPRVLQIAHPQQLLQALSNVLQDRGAAAAAPDPDAPFPLAANEGQRLISLERAGLVDTPPEDAFDRLTWLACRTLKTPIALLTVLTAQRQWFKSKQGLELDGTPRSMAFCNYTILQRDVFAVPDLSEDARFARNPAVLDEPRFRFYAGAPVLDPDGFAIGSLCVIDYTPRMLDAEARQMLAALAALASDGLRLRAADRQLRWAVDSLSKGPRE